jgi:hypothetical protein
MDDPNTTLTDGEILETEDADFANITDDADGDDTDTTDGDADDADADDSDSDDA